MVTKYVGSYADLTIGLIHMKREICRCCSAHVVVEMQGLLFFYSFFIFRQMVYPNCLNLRNLISQLNQNTRLYHGT